LETLFETIVRVLSLNQWFLTGERQEISKGARALKRFAACKVFERKSVPFNLLI